MTAAVKTAATRVYAYVAGAGRNTEAEGGHAYILREIRDNDALKTAAKKAAGVGTNIRMTLLAIIAVMERVAVSSRSLTIFTADQFIANAFTDYLSGWKANGWRNRQGRAVANSDLFARIDDLMDRNQTSIEWLPRDLDDPNMNRARGLARQAARTA